MLLNCGVGEDSWESLGLQEIKPVNPKGNQSWMFIWKTDAEAQAPILCHLMRRTDSLEKTHAGNDWRQEKKGTTEDEMVGWYRRLNGHEFEQAPGVGDGQGRLACCSPWCHKESDMPSIYRIFCGPFVLLPLPFPASSYLPMSQLFASGGQIIGASASFLPINIHWFPFGLIGWICL